MKTFNEKTSIKYYFVNKSGDIEEKLGERI